AVEGCAAALAANGVRSGHHILAEFGRPEYHLIALLAANKIGASFIVASFSDAEKITRPVDFKLTDSSAPVEMRRGALVMEKSWLAESDTFRPVANVIDDDGIQCLFATSGSTGERKYIAISERNLLNRLKVANRDFIGENTRLLCTIGSRTVFATEVHLTTLLRGGSIVVLPMKSDYLAHYIDLFAVSTLITTPLIVEDLVKLDFPRKLYRSLDHVTLSGASAAPTLIEAVAQKVSDRIILTYGNSELGAAAKFTYAKDEFVPGIVGKVFAETDIEIVDEADQAVEQGVQGFVRMRRENAIAEPGYANAGEVGGERFTGDWFYPGDRGWLDAKGNLIIAGRDDNVINVGGNKYSLELIESEIEANLDCRCVALRGEKVPQSETIVLVVSADRLMRSRRILKVIDAQFHRLGVSGIHQADTITMTDTGKKDRVALARLLRSEPNLFRKLA
ncbi:MAG: acyl--CoA ligase, partial [Alphaproteobacteria bacterium]|nr:acyl--CoA ligase [Alphaproteobacteria bacterium]